MQMMKGTIAGFVALVACPCHLPLTIPALLLLTSGTAVGAWLAANTWFVWAGSFALFIGGLALAFLWLGQSATGAQCEVPTNKQSQSRALLDEATTPESNLTTLQNSTAMPTQTTEVSHV